METEVQYLTTRDKIKIEDAVFNLSEVLNVPIDLIIRILDDGIQTNTVPFNRFNAVMKHLKKEYHVEYEKKDSVVTSPILTETPELKPVLTLDLIQVFANLKFSPDKDYIILVKEIRE